MRRIDKGNGHGCILSHEKIHSHEDRATVEALDRIKTALRISVVRMKVTSRITPNALPAPILHFPRGDIMIDQPARPGEKKYPKIVIFSPPEIASPIAVPSMIKEGGRKHLHLHGGGNRVPERSAPERSRGWPMRENSDHCHHNTTAAAFLLHPPSRQHDHHHTIIIETTTMTYQVDGS